MLENHIKIVKKKLITSSILYIVFILSSIYLFIFEREFYTYILLAATVLFLFINASKYTSYLKWIKKVDKGDNMALLIFKSCPHLFFRNYNGFKLPFKEFAIPINTSIDVVILDAISVIEETFNVDDAVKYDVIVTPAKEVILKELREENNV